MAGEKKEGVEVFTRGVIFSMISANVIDVAEACHGDQVQFIVHSQAPMLLAYIWAMSMAEKEDNKFGRFWHQCELQPYR